MTVAISQGRARRARRPSSAPRPATPARRRRPMPPRPASSASCSCRTAGSRPASSPRRSCTAPRLLQVEGGFDDCLAAGPRARRRTTPSSLVNSVNNFRIEGQKTAAFEVVDALGRRPGRALPAGRQRRQHHRLLEGLPRVRRRGRSPRCRGCGASRPPGPRRSCRDAVDEPDTIATAIRIGNPASWDGAVAARDESGGRRSRRSPTTQILAAQRLLAAREGRLRRAGVARRRWPGCCSATRPVRWSPVSWSSAP